MISPGNENFSIPPGRGGFVIAQGSIGPRLWYESRSFVIPIIEERTHYGFRPTAGLIHRCHRDAKV